jgi:uncharacterized protein YybS (DUF2232 family)
MSEPESFLSPELEEWSPELTHSPSSPETLASQPLISGPLMMVETAFLASTTALIWLINYYLPIGPLLRMFFPIPSALAYLRWGRRAAWMTTLVTSLLVSVLMGPPRSLQFLVPYGLVGVLLGGLWRQRVSWAVSMGWGVLVAGTGLFFQVGLLSLLLGTNLWLYLTRQVVSLLDWGFVKLGVLIEPNIGVIQWVAVGIIFVNAALYLLLVHLVAWLVLERLGNPIPDPPEWLKVLLDYQE